MEPNPLPSQSPQRSEVQPPIKDALRLLLQDVGEDPKRDGLRETPDRFVKAFRERTAGLHLDPAHILSCTFTQDDCGAPYGGMVILSHTEFHSTCEHHLAPFFGEAHIVYIPNASGRIVGISKLARLLDCFALRLQVQERMTAQIADAIETYLNPQGVMVIVNARHTCVCGRGVGKQGTRMTTSEVRGLFHSDAAARAEALRLIDCA